MAQATTAETFPLRPTRPWRWLLRMVGVKPGAAEVELTADDRLIARFGPFTLETPIANISGYLLTGPYRFWRAIGPHASGADHGFTFGTSTHGGVCVCFEEWVPKRWVRGGRVESLTVTVDDVDGLARALEARGISGRDERAS